MRGRDQWERIWRQWRERWKLPFLPPSSVICADQKGFRALSKQHLTGLKPRVSINKMHTGQACYSKLSSSALTWAPPCAARLGGIHQDLLWAGLTLHVRCAFCRFSYDHLINNVERRVVSIFGWECWSAGASPCSPAGLSYATGHRTFQTQAVWLEFILPLVSN